jgi:(p)ppGpp synthase/HD superfamily hydrolase
MFAEEKLRSLVLAPYIVKATALIGNARYVGGNQFRHAFATLGILLDYKYFSNSVLLKASLVHDLFEDVPSTDKSILRNLDSDGEMVTNLVLELTRDKNETKATYLKRILETGSFNAKILKVADRISNLTDINRSIFSDNKITQYLDETEQYVIPMAHQVNQDMVLELTDLIKKKRAMITGGF